MNKVKNKKLFRTFAVDAGNIDIENRKVKVAFSSENPVERFFGNEILSHDPKAVDLTRLMDGAPLLLQHDPERQIGVVEVASIDADKIGRATVRFSKSAEAQDIFQDVVDGIRSKISVGYLIDEMEQDLKKKENYTATRWSPLELSIVSIPADSTVGVGRSENLEEENNLINNNSQIIKIKENKMEETKVTSNEDVLKSERVRVEEIEATSAKFVGRVSKVDELRSEAVKKGWTSERFKGEIADRISDSKPFEAPSSEIGLSQKEKNKYSIRNLILSQIPNTGVRADFEREVSNAVVSKTGRAPRGLFLPYDLQTRDLLAGSGTGANLVGTQFQPQNFQEMLYANQVSVKLGAKSLTGLSQNIAIPKRTAGATSYWVTENAAVTESAATFGQITMSPKTVGAKTDLSRNLLMQGLPSVDTLIQEDMATQLALAIDKAVYFGSGSSGEPTGIVSTSGVGGVTITSNTVSWANLLEFESDVLNANVNSTNCAFVSTPAIQAILKSKVKVSSDSREFAQHEGKVNGYGMNVSSAITSGYLLFGDHSQILVGYFGNGLDIVVDPYSGSNAGTVAITSFISCDVAVRVAASFSVASGITA